MTDNQTQQETPPRPARGQRKALRGTVVSDAMERTIVVQVERMARHPRYRKTIKVRRKFYAHDQENQAKVGDVVEIMSTRPLSKLKRWRLVRIIQSAPRRG